MCVTNTIFRRQQPISLPQQQQQQQQHQQHAAQASGLTQRLLSTFQLSAASASASVPRSNVAEFYVLPQKGTSQQESVCSSSSATSIHNNCNSKPRPKRRRKPQKPGKTAKMNDRHFVVHNYHDHALDEDDSTSTSSTSHSNSNSEHEMEEAQAQLEQHHEHEHAHAHSTTSTSVANRKKGGVAVAFPLKLHAVLDQVEADGLAHVVSWSRHGRCFVIHQPKEFVESVMPKYFRQTKLTSFQRQLNLYGFSRLTRGPDASGYYHELFLRGKTHLCKRMVRTKVKGTKFKAASSPEQEPDFYKMPPVVVVSASSTTQHVTPPTTSDEEMSHDSSCHGGTTCTVSSSNNPSVAPSILSSSMLYTAPSLNNREPFPVSFVTSQQQQQQQQALAFPTPFQFAPVVAVAAPPSSLFSYDPAADQILDQAVDELFLQESSLNNDLVDVCSEWSSSSNPLNSAFAESLEDDQQLGFMLEKLLED